MTDAERNEPRPHAPPRHALQQRVADAILDAASRVVAAHGQNGSMGDIAAAAGVARATVYRYFPNRDAMLAELADAAARDATERLRSARVDEVPPLEGIARCIRALVEVGDPLVVLARERPLDDDGFEREVQAPLRRLLEKARRRGEIRADVPAAWLADALLGLVLSGLGSTHRLGREDAIAATTRLFLDGARARADLRAEDASHLTLAEQGRGT